MKLKNPEDEKYFKDIVLNNILEEISNESKTALEHSYKTKKTSKKSYRKLISYIIITLLLLLAVILFAIILDTSSKITSATKVSNTPLVNTQKHQKEFQSQTIKIQATKNKPMLKQKTERELAKEALRQQILN